MSFLLANFLGEDFKRHATKYGPRNERPIHLVSALLPQNIKRHYMQEVKSRLRLENHASTMEAQSGTMQRNIKETGSLSHFTAIPSSSTPKQNSQ